VLLAISLPANKNLVDALQSMVGIIAGPNKSSCFLALNVLQETTSTKDMLAAAWLTASTIAA
jgi:hypothetical protein